MQMGAQEGDGKAPPGGQVRNCPVPAGPGKAPPKLPALPAQNRQEPQQHREGGPGVQRKGLWIRPRGSECRGASDGWSLGGGVSCALGGVGVLCEGTGPGQRGPGRGMSQQALRFLSPRSDGAEDGSHPPPPPSVHRVPQTLATWILLGCGGATGCHSSSEGVAGEGRGPPGWGRSSDWRLCCVC